MRRSVGIVLLSIGVAGAVAGSTGVLGARSDSDAGRVTVWQPECPMTSEEAERFWTPERIDEANRNTRFPGMARP